MRTCGGPSICVRWTAAARIDPAAQHMSATGVSRPVDRSGTYQDQPSATLPPRPFGDHFRGHRGKRDRPGLGTSGRLIRPWRPGNQAGRATLLDMRATIKLPEPVFQILQARAEQRSLSIQAVILEAINKEIEHGPTPAEVKGRVSLPLIRSSRPGSLHSLTNAQIDDILG